jgi:hypothetical protein
MLPMPLNCFNLLLSHPGNIFTSELPGIIVDFLMFVAFDLSELILPSESCWIKPWDYLFQIIVSLTVYWLFLALSVRCLVSNCLWPYTVCSQLCLCAVMSVIVSDHMLAVSSSSVHSLVSNSYSDIITICTALAHHVFHQPPQLGQLQGLVH